MVQSLHNQQERLWPKALDKIQDSVNKRLTYVSKAKYRAATGSLLLLLLALKLGGGLGRGKSRGYRRCLRQETWCHLSCHMQFADNQVEHLHKPRAGEGTGRKE